MIRCLTHLEIAGLLDSTDSSHSDSTSEAQRHLNSCDTCLQKMQQVLMGAVPYETRSQDRASAEGIESKAPPEIPGYSFERVIGVGGMGAVWKAVQHSPRRTVAVKFIRKSSDDQTGIGRESLDRMRQEADAAARLQHPSVVTLYEFRDDPLVGPFLTMEFVSGGTLAEQMLAGPTDPKKACELLRRLAEAVGFANSREVIHRDLKPTNILLSDDGTPKISDFGIARLQDTDVAEAAEIVGTPHYMAPEQARGEKADGRADVYSLGVILFEMVTGQTPFVGKTVAAVLLSIERTEPPRARLLRSGIPKEVETICEKCLRRNPDQRYSSAFELAADLDRFLSGRPILALPVSQFQRSLMWAKRNKMASAAIALGACIAFVFTPLGIYLWLTAESERTNAKSAKEYSLGVIVGQPSEEDFDPVQKRVRLRNFSFQPIEKTVEGMKKLDPLLGNTPEGNTVRMLTLAIDAKKVAVRGDWKAADIAFRLVFDEIARLKSLKLGTQAEEMLRLMQAQYFVEHSMILRNLERFTEAEESTRRAVAELEPVVGNRENVDCKRICRDSLLEQIRSLRFLGEHIRADKIAKEAIGAAEELAVKPGDLDDITSAARCYVLCAQQPGPNSDTESVRKYAERGFALHLRVHQSYPTYLLPACETADASLQLARSLKAIENLPSAKEHAKIALDLVLKVRSTNPDYVELTYGELSALSVLADLNLHEGDKTEALRLATQAVRLLESKVTPENKSDLSVLDISVEVYAILAAAQSRSNLLVESDASYQRVIEAIQLFPTSGKDNLRVILALSNIRMDLAELKLRRGQKAASQLVAKDALLEVKSWAEKKNLPFDERLQAVIPLERLILPEPLLASVDELAAATLFREITAHIDKTSVHHDKLEILTVSASLLQSVAFVRAGRKDEALDALKKTVRGVEAIVQTRPNDPQRQSILGRSLFFAARSYLQLGNTFECADTARKAIEIRRAVLKSKPKDFYAADNLAFTLCLLGDALQPNADQEVEDAYREAVTIWDDLEDRFPKAVVTQLSRGAALDRVGYCQYEHDQFQKAEKSLEAAGKHYLLANEYEQRLSNFQPRLIDHYYYLARFRAKQNDHEQCHENIMQMLKHGKDRKQVLFSSASLLCWCARLAGSDQQLDAEKQTKLGKQYADEAVKKLSEAIDAGFDNLASIETDRNLKLLVGRSDFQHQMTRLKQNK